MIIKIKEGGYNSKLLETLRELMKKKPYKTESEFIATGEALMDN